VSSPLARSAEAADASPMEMDGMVMGSGGDAWGDRPAPMLMPIRPLYPGDWSPPGSVHVMGNFAAIVTNPGFAHASDPQLGRDHAYVLADWIMIEGRTRDGWLEGIFMPNFEALTFTRAGWYEIGQSGEGLWDRQHQHQLVHQALLALHLVGREERDPFKLTLWGGQGSASIGPPIFMHRASNPSPTVPRKHHKGENPHETFPVIGATFEWRGTALDVSAFSAYEFSPDDSRLYPRAHAPKSYAARLRQRIGPDVEVQISGERLNDQGDRYVQLAAGAPIVDAGPEEDAYQLSASIYGRSVGRVILDGLLDFALDAPVNGGHPSVYAWLGELAVRSASMRDVGWSRIEINDRVEPDDVTVSRRWLFASIGYEHVAWVDPASVFGLGVFLEITAVHVPSVVEPEYGQSWGATTTFGLHGQLMWMSGDHGMRHAM